LRYAIIDTNYTQAHYGIAASWLRWTLERLGVCLTTPAEADCILYTVTSAQAAEKFRFFRRKNHGKISIVGGGAGYAPAVFGNIIDAACAGDGSRFIRTLVLHGLDEAKKLPEAWVPGETRTVIPNQDFNWDCPPIMHPDGSVRVFVDHGCKHKCLFCQVAWERPFIPHPQPEKIRLQCEAIRKAGYQYDLLTNDGSDVELMSGLRFISVRFHALKKMAEGLNKKFVKSVRIGVEGVSERIRKAIGKPISNDDLIRVSRKLLKKNIQVRWFFIVGLPYETAADYDELDYLARGVGTFDYGMINSVFHSYVPQSAAPLGALPMRDEYYDPMLEFTRQFFDGPLFTKRLQIIKASMYEKRMVRAKQAMACEEQDLRRGFMEEDNANWRIQYVLPPDRLRQIAAKYAEKMGAVL